jgi:DNA polymerase II large subunit
MRRDLDGDESSIILLMDALLNFSRQFLPNHRGAAQDACLVMTTRLNPAEVDDMVFDLDVAWKYPLEFYQSFSKGKQSFKIEKLGDRINTYKQYEEMGYTHETSSINSGVLCSAYKTIPTMEDKLKGRMELARKIRAVDASDVAKLVIEKHFLKDIKGNLRKFSTQEFRCSKCGERFRRPSLHGKCDICSGKLTFTVSEGSILKYLEPSISLANKYDVPLYIKRSLEVTKRRIEGIFGRTSDKQVGLKNWFN